jgi:hypothetical protein
VTVTITVAMSGLRRGNESARNRRSGGRCKQELFESAHGVPSLMLGLEDSNKTIRASPLKRNGTVSLMEGASAAAVREATAAIDAGYRADREGQFDLSRPRGLTSPPRIHSNSDIYNRKE